MTRLKVLAAHPRRTLGALAVVLAAVGLTVGSGANFTASKANPSNTFSTGMLSIYDSNEGAAILTASNMKPGDTKSGAVDIENIGSLAGDFELDGSTLTGSAALANALDVTVTDCGEWSDPSTANDCATGGDESVVYSGSLGALGTKPLQVFDPDEKHTYKFDVSLPETTGDGLQGKTVTATFVWNAVQS